MWLPPPMITVGLVGLKAQESEVESASPCDLSCFDIGAFVLSTKGTGGLEKMESKGLGGVRWGLDCRDGGTGDSGAAVRKTE